MDEYDTLMDINLRGVFLCMKYAIPPMLEQGSGSVITSSPTCPVTARPVSSNASTLAPRERHWMRPRRIGCSGFGPTKPVQTSVPPHREPSQTSDLTWS